LYHRFVFFVLNAMVIFHIQTSSICFVGIALVHSRYFAHW
jgi:hypothetical protein